jgi:geranylgeranyl diphosphate synthase type II
MDVSEEEYIQMIQYKTSVLLACSVKLGAIIAGASKEDQENMYQFGLNLGLAFQIKDDYLDSFGEGDKVGKRIGGDILNNKKTLLLITALRKAEGKDKEELLVLLNEQDENKKIANIKTLFVKMGVKEYAEEKMQTLFTKSLDYLSKVNADADRMKSLATFAEKVYYREF